MNASVDAMKKRVYVATGRAKADLVLKNATFVNVFTLELTHADIAILNDEIIGIGKYHGVVEIDASGKYICPGFIDGLVHLESSMLTPAEFASAVIPHGTTTVIADPHEIVNVIGKKGLDYMMQATENLPLDVFFVSPSCVPATEFDETGGTFDSDDILASYSDKRVIGLAEMMNYACVVNAGEDVLTKLADAKNTGHIVNGHAPDLKGSELCAYISTGVLTEHECSDLSAALERIRLGQYILIREGTAAKYLRPLVDLLTPKTYKRCAFCSDDKHPNDLLNFGHIDHNIREAVALGVSPLIAVCVATLNTAECYGLRDRGAVAVGYKADLTIIDSLEKINVKTVIKNGKIVYSGKPLTIESPYIDPKLYDECCHTFKLKERRSMDFQLNGASPVIAISRGELTTADGGMADEIDVAADILKLSIIERYKGTSRIASCYLNGYGLKSGAIATSVAHDSHNLIVVGTNEHDMAVAANRVVKNNGGLAIADHGKVIRDLPLPIAGLMTDCPLEEVNEKLKKMKSVAASMGVPEYVDPFMTLSFLSLPVLPSLRLTTFGVLDVEKRKLVSQQTKK